MACCGGSSRSSIEIRRDAQHQRILAAAMACFSRTGFHSASMNEICREAGMSAGNLYRYFPSKDSIIEALAEEERIRNSAFFQALEDAEDPVAGLIDIGLNYLNDAASREFRLCTEVLAEAQRNPRISEMFQKNIAQAREALGKALTRGVENGQVEASLDIEMTVKIIMALGDGLLAHRNIDPSLPGPRLDTAFRGILERLLRPRS